MKNKKSTNNKIKEMSNRNMKNFIDVQTITLLLYLSGNPKTRSEMMIELKEIPPASLYRKIKSLNNLD